MLQGSLNGEQNGSFHPSKEVFEAHPVDYPAQTRCQVSIPLRKFLRKRARWVTTPEHESFHPSKEVFEASLGVEV